MIDHSMVQAQDGGYALFDGVVTATEVGRKIAPCSVVRWRRNELGGVESECVAKIPTPDATTIDRVQLDLPPGRYVVRAPLTEFIRLVSMFGGALSCVSYYSGPSRVVRHQKGRRLLSFREFDDGGPSVLTIQEFPG